MTNGHQLTISDNARASQGQNKDDIFYYEDCNTC
jgi:hypothetical protein